MSGGEEQHSVEHTWTDNIERVLDQLRLNCAQLSNYHRYKYIYYKNQVKWFKIPIIFLSGVNTFMAVGMQENLEQSLISIITSMISLVCGIITGIEMFMKYQDKMVLELNTHRDYYKISIEIYKVISIDRHMRDGNGTTYLDAKFSEYEKIKSRSNPEQHFDLVHDILADEDELILYKRETTKRHKKGWVNKIELAPPLFDRDKTKYDINLGYDKYRHPLKHILRERTRKVEDKKRMSQKYLDLKWIDRNKTEKERNNMNGTPEELQSESPRPKIFYNETEKRGPSKLTENVFMEMDEKIKDRNKEEEATSSSEDTKQNDENIPTKIETEYEHNEYDNQYECESDYNCPLSERGFSIMDLFKNTRKSLYYHSDSDDNEMV